MILEDYVLSTKDGSARVRVWKRREGQWVCVWQGQGGVEFPRPSLRKALQAIGCAIDIDAWADDAREMLLSADRLAPLPGGER